MTKFRLDYVWLEGEKPTANIRIKAQIVELESFNGNSEETPVCGFDGSATRQAEELNSGGNEHSF